MVNQAKVSLEIILNSDEIGRCIISESADNEVVTTAKLLTQLSPGRKPGVKWRTEFFKPRKRRYRQYDVINIAMQFHFLLE